MKGRKVALILSLVIVGILAFPSVITMSARATSMTQATAFPSALNETVSVLAPGYGQTILDDGSTWPDLYSRYGGVSCSIITNDFNNPTYYVSSPSIFSTGNHAPSNSTIISVWLVALFTGIGLPLNLYWITDLAMAYSHTDPVAFQATTAPTAHVFAEYDRVGEATNITAFESWTPGMLNDHNLSVRISMTLPANKPVYLDYLGIYYTWEYAPGGGGSDPSLDIGSSLMPSPIGMFGIIGFVGMIAVPAAGIWFARRTDGSRLILGLQVMTVFVVFLGLFLASIL
jgi:hypothetical protein